MNEDVIKKDIVKRLDFKLLSLEMTHDKISAREKMIVREFLYDIKGDLITLLDFETIQDNRNEIDLMMKYLDTAINDLYFMATEELKRIVSVIRKILVSIYKSELQSTNEVMKA